MFIDDLYIVAHFISCHIQHVNRRFVHRGTLLADERRCTNYLHAACGCYLQWSSGSFSRAIGQLPTESDHVRHRQQNHARVQRSVPIPQHEIFHGACSKQASYVGTRRVAAEICRRSLSRNESVINESPVSSLRGARNLSVFGE